MHLLMMLLLQNMRYLLLPEERLAMQISRQPGPELAGWTLELCAAPLLLLLSKECARATASALVVDRASGCLVLGKTLS